MQTVPFFQKLQAFKFDSVETTQCLAISIDFEQLRYRVKPLNAQNSNFGSLQVSQRDVPLEIGDAAMGDSPLKRVFENFEILKHWS